MLNQNGNYIMENIFKPYPTFSQAVITENEALDILKKYDNVLLETLNGRDVHKSEPYCVYIKDESDLHWLINLFGADRTRKKEVIRAFYNVSGDAVELYLKDSNQFSDDEFYCLSLKQSESSLARYKNHSCNGIIAPFNDEIVKNYGFELKDDVLDTVYIINNGTPAYSMSGTYILIYKCSLISPKDIEPRQLVRINTKEKFIV